MTQGWKKTLSIMLCAAMIASVSVLAFAEGQTDEEQTPSVTGEELDGGYQVSEAVVAAAGALEALPELDSLNEQTDADALLVQVQAARAAVEALTEEEKTALSTDAADLLNKLDELEFFFANRPVTAPEDAAVSFLNAEPAPTTGLQGDGSETNPYLAGNEDELKEAVAQGGHIKLTDNIELENYIVLRSDATINMDNYCITANAICGLITKADVSFIGGTIILNAQASTNNAVQVDANSHLTIKGTTIKTEKGQSALAVNGGTVTIETGILSGQKAGVVMLVPQKASPRPTPRLIVEGGTITGGDFGIAGNGTNDGTEIKISGGTITGGSCAVYHPQVGNLTIEGGTLTGPTGVQYCGAGELNISGGTIHGTAPYTSFPTKPAEQGDGSVDDGAAVSIVSRGAGYQDEGQTMKVSITGGNLISDHNAAITAYRYQQPTPNGSWVTNDATKLNSYLSELNIGSGASLQGSSAKGTLELDAKVEPEKVTIENGATLVPATGVDQYLKPGQQINSNGVVVNPSTPSTPSTPTTPSTGASSTVQQMEEREKPDPANEKMTEAYNFWQQVKARIRSAKDGKMLKITVNKNAEYMPASVMQTLFEREDVGLTLYWNGKTIVIPAGKAMPKQPMKVYWTVKTLLELYA